MNEERTIALPDANEMQRRLISVADEPHAVASFYPLLTRHAGQKMSGQDVATTFIMAITDYTERMEPYLAEVLYTSLPEYIEALIEDAEVREEAMRMLRKSGII